MRVVYAAGALDAETEVWGPRRAQLGRVGVERGADQAGRRLEGEVNARACAPGAAAGAGVGRRIAGGCGAFGTGARRRRYPSSRFFGVGGACLGGSYEPSPLARMQREVELIMAAKDSGWPLSPSWCGVCGERRDAPCSVHAAARAKHARASRMRPAGTTDSRLGLTHRPRRGIASPSPRLTNRQLAKPAPPERKSPGSESRPAGAHDSATPKAHGGSPLPASGSRSWSAISHR
jgi:hypothetical protein